jgi:hypothetical protein
VRDHTGQALAYVYFEDEPGRRSWPNFAKLPDLLVRKLCNPKLDYGVSVGVPAPHEGGHGVPAGYFWLTFGRRSKNCMKDPAILDRRA